MKPTAKKAKRSESGQAAVEFMSVVIVFFFFLFFLASFALVLVLSSYMDYVAFMTARTFQSATGDVGTNGVSDVTIAEAPARAGATPSTQFQHAVSVFNDYVGPLSPTVIRNATLTIVQNTSREQVSGVQIRYELNLFYMPPIFLGNAAPSSRVTLTSEARLGREPTTRECLAFFTSYMSKFGIPSTVNGASVQDKLDDSGC